MTNEVESTDTNGVSSKSTNKIDLNELRELSHFFGSLIDTIPPKIYFAKNEDVIEVIEANKQLVCEDMSLSKKAKHKRVKLDPKTQQKVSDVANTFIDKQKKNNKMGELQKKLAKRIKMLRQNRGAPDSKISTFTNSETENVASTTKHAENKDGDSLPKIYNKKGDLVFTKFDFASHVDLAADKELQKSKQKKQSLKGLLVKAKKTENKIARLEKTNTEAASKIKEKKMWKSALERAEGNKVRDNPKLIEKTLQQRKKKRVKHAKEWAERKKSVEVRMQKKQEKRQRHIEERKQGKKDKKVKRFKKNRN